MQKKSINWRYKYKKYNKTANLIAGNCDKTADINAKKCRYKWEKCNKNADINARNAIKLQI